MQSAQERPDYFEQGIERIEYYGAQLAILHYRTGSTWRLGLVEPYIVAPLQSVGCHAQPGELIVLEGPGIGLGFTTYAEMAAQGTQHPKEPYPEHVRRVMRRIELHSAPQGRVIPNHVNAITAPALCRVLNDLEAEFIRQCDSMAEATVGALESTLLILNLALLKEGLRAPVSSIGRVATRTTGPIVSRGLSREAAEAALAGMHGGGGHASRHLLSAGLIPNTGSLASRTEAFRRIASPILTRPLGRPFAWRIGDTQATAFLGRSAGRWVAVIVADNEP